MIKRYKKHGRPNRRGRRLPTKPTMTAFHTLPFIEAATANGTVGLLVIDRAHRYCYVSPSMALFRRADQTGIVGKTVADVHGATYEKIYKPLLDRAFAGELLSYIEYIDAEIAAGSVRVCNITLAPFTDGSGQYVTITLSDVTRLSETQIELDTKNRALSDLVHARTDELKVSEQRFHTIADMCTDGYWDLKLESGYLFISPSYKRLLGYNDNEIANRQESWKQLVHPEDLAATLAVLSESVERGTPLSVQYRIRHRNGSYLWVSSHGWIIKSSDGTPERVIGAIVDVTRLKESEERLRIHNSELEFSVQERTIELQRQMERLDQIVATVPGVLFTLKLDERGIARFVYVSPGVERLIGKASCELPDDLEGIIASLNLDDRLQMLSAVRESARTLTTLHEVVRIEHPERGTVWIECKAEPFAERDLVTYAQGAVVWYGLLTDVSERMKLLERAQMLQEEAEQKAAQLVAARVLTTEILTSKSGSEVLRRIAEAARNLTSVAYSVIYVRNSRAIDVAPIVSAGLSSDCSQMLIKHGDAEKIVNSLVNVRRPIFIPSLQVVYPDLVSDCALPESGVVVCIPILIGTEIAGGIIVADSVEGRRSYDSYVAALMTLADSAAVAIHYLRMMVKQREVTHEFINMLDAERRTFAFDLHDGVAQYIMASKLYLESASEQEGTDRVAAQTFRNRAMDALDCAVREASRMVNSLRALTLDEVGLVGAIGHLLTDERKLRDQTKYFFTQDLDSKRFTIDIETALYHTTVKALSNIRNFAEAENVFVGLHLTEADEMLILSIVDDGVGFEFSGVPDLRHIGLSGMQERVRLVGGYLSITSSEGQGTHVTAVVPLNRNSLRDWDTDRIKQVLADIDLKARQ